MQLSARLNLITFNLINFSVLFFEIFIITMRAYNNNNPKTVLLDGKRYCSFYLLYKKTAIFLKLLFFLIMFVYSVYKRSTNKM
jgi:hypothetical protein